MTELRKFLATQNDSICLKEKGPAMKFEGEINVGAKGGNVSIRYLVEKYIPSEIIQFRFLKLNGFNGIHKFELIEVTP